MARYSEQCRRPGELSAPEAAQLLGITSTTICRWAKDAIAGEPSRLSLPSIRRDIAGRYWFAADAIVDLVTASESA